MLKKLLVLLLLTSFNLSAKDEAVVCPMIYYSKVKTIVEKEGSFDKYKHCAVSCLLTLRCPAVDVLQIGVLKELLDVVGPGQAEMEDLEADYEGVALVTRKKVKTDKACISACHKLYPQNACR